MAVDFASKAICLILTGLQPGVMERLIIANRFNGLSGSSRAKVRHCQRFQ